MKDKKITIKATIVVTLLIISFLSFIVPFRKETEMNPIKNLEENVVNSRTIKSIQPQVSKTDIYYNIYGIEIKRVNVGTEVLDWQHTGIGTEPD